MRNPRIVWVGGAILAELPTIFTAGHSNMPTEEFVGLLKANAIDLVVDIRSHPRSKYASQFDGDALPDALEQAALAYEYLGDELGGRPDGEEFYDQAGHVLYGRVSKSEAFLRGLMRLRSLAQGQRVALMCSEEDPAGCHRRLLVGRMLRENGYPVMHLRRDGHTESEDDLAQAESRARQMQLFEETEEEAWRSVRRVPSPPRKKRLP